ncbi:uncharacterized protein LOC111707721 [Eurytemora carolleeae]|uniref:uncharacterized protein LOC111707721 n=1 Tax=Eurytemora carolleeae TaxID=1294199 RepID=UPI000C78C58B|nr:uncharacterized protein LOC111707721 [Eurytemora carolleeae]|eukprot:XP_023336633.1 uncharacterized protein LOC111707721 [Eurytemora affinis]
MNINPLNLFFLLKVRLEKLITDYGMMTFYDGLEGKDCLTWCYFFVPYFGEPNYFYGVCLICLVLLLVWCHAVIAFCFAIFHLVFWSLTCFQCPLPCKHYSAMCDESFLCQDWLMFWAWPSFFTGLLGVSGWCSFKYQSQCTGLLSGEIRTRFLISKKCCGHEAPSSESGICRSVSLQLRSSRLLNILDRVD